MVGESEIRQIVVEMKVDGFDVNVRDVAFAFLSRSMEDKFAYAVVFPGPGVPSVEEYIQSKKVTHLAAYLAQEYPASSVEQQSEAEVAADKSKSLSFDEVKAGLETDLKTLEELRDQKDDDGMPVLEPKDMAAVVGRISDIRTKLVQKFGTSETVAEQRVVVLPHYDKICPYCGHEVCVGTNN